MSYVKFEARHFDDDRWLDMSPAAFVVHAWALSYCNEQATDGVISQARAGRLVCPVPPTKLAAAWGELVAADLWRDTGDGYLCDTFTAHGIAADEQNETRSKWAADKRRQRLHHNGNHSICSPRTCTAARMSTGGQVDSSTGDKWTTRPDPTRPDQTQPEGLGSGLGGGNSRTSAGAPSGEPPEVEKHHPVPGCCALSDYPNNRHHYQPGECTGCKDPTHADERAQFELTNGRPDPWADAPANVRVDRKADRSAQLRQESA